MSETGIEKLKKAIAESLADQKCPACGSDSYNQKHHHGDWHAPECWWWECDNCGHRTEPE